MSYRGSFLVKKSLADSQVLRAGTQHGDMETLTFHQEDGHGSVVIDVMASRVSRAGERTREGWVILACPLEKFRTQRDLSDG